MVDSASVRGAAKEAVQGIRQLLREEKRDGYSAVATRHFQVESALEYSHYSDVCVCVCVCVCARMCVGIASQSAAAIEDNRATSADKE